MRRQTIGWKATTDCKANTGSKVGSKVITGSNATGSYKATIGSKATTYLKATGGSKATTGSNAIVSTMSNSSAEVKMGKSNLPVSKDRRIHCSSAGSWRPFCCSLVSDADCGSLWTYLALLLSRRVYAASRINSARRCLFIASAVTRPPPLVESAGALRQPECSQLQRKRPHDPTLVLWAHQTS